jgi:hypothetical protein
VGEHGNESKLLNEVVNSLSEMVRSLSDKLSSLCNELTEVKAQLKNTKEMELKNKTADLSEVASESSRELVDKDRRKANLIWFGIPESTASDAKDRVMYGTAFVVDCCSKVLYTSIDVTSCKRLRLKDTAANTFRPLLVTVKDSVKFWSVLKTARKLGESADYKSVFVKKDSIPLERAVFRKRWQERIRIRRASNVAGLLAVGEVGEPPYPRLPRGRPKACFFAWPAHRPPCVAGGVAAEIEGC